MASKKKVFPKKSPKLAARPISMTAKLALSKKLGLTKEDHLAFLKNIFLSRKLDDTEIMMRKQNTAFFQISGAGHEGILTALAKVLRPGYDYFLPYYRDRALCLSLGVTPLEMLSQANGNLGDTSSLGRQMPAHWGNRKLNIVNKSSCTGTQFLQAVGVAETGKYLESLSLSDGPPWNKDEIIYVSTGDGTTSQGEFWESLTTAVVNKLPVLYLVEDNGYAISVPVRVQTPEGSISKTLKNFPGLQIYETNGHCPVESYETALKAEKHLRAQKGPVLIHAHVTRPYSHSLSDDHRSYRTSEELQKEEEQDVINSYPSFLLKGKILSSGEIEELKVKVNEDISLALKECLQTPWPNKETSTDFTWSPDVDPSSSDFDRPGTFEGKEDIPMAQTINHVLKTEVKRNPLLRIFGEDIADFSDDWKFDTDLKGKGGVFKVTSGVQSVGRPGQVFNSPLAEANIIGRAIGMAARGLKPVVEIQFFDYIWTAFMQLKNEMATMRYRSGGTYSAPMVVRAPIGGYLKGGAIYHSQTGESIFTHIPGIRVVYPSHAADAAGLLRTAIRSDDPVLFLEHKHLYYQGYNRTADPGDEYMIPFGLGKIVKEGRDITLLTWGALVQKSLDAAKRAESEGHSVEVIDVRTLVPFDMDILKKSLSKTNRLLIAHEECQTSGFAGEIAAKVNEECFEYLDAPILRVSSKDSHVPYCPSLEEDILPQTDDIFHKLNELLNY
ncbi:MAG: dehydrogenase E1 component subunit alpha/beta [Bacteriovoracales bacterium]|nr:dehydrogenase E1 component subunit alpha/beta [Bacteriovoracales bacterium]